MCLRLDRDMSGGTFKIQQVASAFRKAHKALSEAAASPMQAGRALDVLFEKQAATARGGPAAERQAGVGNKRLHNGSAAPRQADDRWRVTPGASVRNGLPSLSF